MAKRLQQFAAGVSSGVATCHGENAELYAALATVLYYQASQHMTAQTRAMIDKALALDSNEITALMLLASDAFMQANYAQAIGLMAKSDRISTHPGSTGHS